MTYIFTYEYLYDKFDCDDCIAEQTDIQEHKEGGGCIRLSDSATAEG